MPPLKRIAFHSAAACALAALFAGFAGGCKRPEERQAEVKSAAPSAVEEVAAETLKQMAATLEKALRAYNTGDREALFADFATVANPAPSERIFAELYQGYYQAEFGKIAALRLLERETVPDAEAGMLVYAAQCEKVPLAKVSANFLRENGALKIVQLRLEKVETAAK